MLAYNVLDPSLLLLLTARPEAVVQAVLAAGRAARQASLPRPAFGSSPNMQARHAIHLISTARIRSALLLYLSPQRFCSTHSPSSSLPFNSTSCQECFQQSPCCTLLTIAQLTVGSTQALLHDVEERQDTPPDPGGPEFSFLEVTIASVDQPKLLCRLSAALVSIVNFGLTLA